jgi:NADH-quinone oxidoreductase subunit I
VSAVLDFLKKIFLFELLVGLSVTLRNQFRPHVTMEYPRERPDLKPRYRGVPRIRAHPDTGEELCVACLLCEKACPDDCIKVVPEKRPDGKGKQPAQFIINYERCCFCGLCVDPCPTKPLTAIYMSHDFELANESRERFYYPKENLYQGVPITEYTR